MRRWRSSCSLWVVLVSAASAMAGSPIPLDRPSPPPCAADGICYPNVNEWGYYSVRWRRWPGHELEPEAVEPTPAEKLGPDIEPYELPTPEEEDERAPPSTTKREPEAPAFDTDQEGAESLDSIDQLDGPSQPGYPPPSGSGTPPPSRPGFSPPRPGLTPSGPGYRSPLNPPESPLQPSQEPTSDMDPPPAPPFAQNSSRRHSGTSAAMLPMEVQTPRPVSRTRAASDPPPAVPWAHSASL